MRERDAERGRVRRQAVGHGDRDEAAVERHGVDGHLRPLDVLLDEHGAAAGLRDRGRDRGIELLGGPDERKATLPLPVGRFTTTGNRSPGSRGSSSSACRTPPDANAAR